MFIATYYKPAYRYGGTVRADSGLCEALARSGIDVDVFTTNVDGDSVLDVPLEDPVEEDGVEVCYYPIEFKSYLET